MGTLAGVILGAIGAAIGTVGGPIGTAAGLCIGASIGGWLGSSDKKVPDLLLKVKRGKDTIEGSTKEIDVFEVQVKGGIVVPKTNTEVDFILLLRDCTGGTKFEEADFVATSDDSYSSMGNGVFSPTRTDTLPNEANEFKVWTTIFIVPIEHCIFPYRGTREIEFGLLTKDKKNNTLAFTSTKITVQVNEIGYLDQILFREKSEGIALELIHILVFNNSKFFPTNTVDVISSWIKSRSELRETDPDKDKIQKSLTATFTKMKNSTATVPVSSAASLARELSEYVSVAEKYAFMEFFLCVMATFENISTDDFKLIDLISQEMGLDDKEYQEAKHKCLLIHKIDESNAFAILGISMNLSRSEIKQKLKDSFRKWNSLAVHKNPAIREKAEKMLNLIAECEKQLSHY